MGEREPPDDRFDWDPDQSGVVDGDIEWEGDGFTLRDEYEDPGLYVHSKDDGTVTFTIEDGADGFRWATVSLTTDEVETFIEQLETANEWAKEGKGADIRA